VCAEQGGDGLGVGVRRGCGGPDVRIHARAIRLEPCLRGVGSDCGGDGCGLGCGGDADGEGGLVGGECSVDEGHAGIFTYSLEVGRAGVDEHPISVEGEAGAKEAGGGDGDTAAGFDGVDVEGDYF